LLQTAQAFADKVKGAGGQVELFLYDEAGHGFLNVGEEVSALLHGCAGQDSTTCEAGVPSARLRVGAHAEAAGVPPALPHAQAKAKRAYMGFPEPPKEAQGKAWERVLAFFDAQLKSK
jgi:dienelactone hydrolase